MTNTQLETGTYEIIRNRLLTQGSELRSRLANLNDERKTVFGAIETQLIANDRITTENFCIARDIMAIGDRCIFGYNVHIGLRSGTALSDVFSIYTFANGGFHKQDLSFLEDEKFAVDFANLYRYYKETHFAKFAVIGTYLYMVFQVSKNVNDIKAFKWLINGDQLEYVDARSDHEFRFPTQHEFNWQRVTRDMHRFGSHPHVSILDKVFVETVGGDLTIKVEDNTDDGKGIYNEPVNQIDQTLDDAEYYFADIGNLIALRIKPYQEDFRYFIFNNKMQTVERIDTLAEAAVLLPDNHGIIFSNGYYLQSGDYKIFDVERRGKLFERRIASPNGEDHLYVFYSKTHGRYVLMSYNVISQTVATPIVCHGYTVFPNGELAYFRAEEEQTKHHVVQIWQTPFITGDLIPSEHTDSYLYKVGNKDIVKAMAECSEVLTLLNKEDSFSGLYLDLVKKTTDVLDSYYWIDKAESFKIHEPLGLIRESANSAIEEFEKVQRIKKNTAAEIERIQTKATELFTKIKRTTYNSVDLFVEMLASLRTIRGEAISLRELRYTDLELIEKIETEASELSDKLSKDCVQFLLDENALTPYAERVAEANGKVDALKTAVEANQLGEDIDKIGEDLKLLIDIVSNLKIDDATETTRIIDNISDIYATLNQAKAAQNRKRKSLFSTEATAEFAAQLKLLDQGIVNYLDVSDTPQKCDEYLTKLMVQLEELEGKFAEFDEFIPQISDKREEIYNAFETRKLDLTEARNRRTASLEAAAERILNGIRNRLKNFKEVSEINGFFASDLMIEKVRDIIKQLTSLEDNVKADSIQSQLKTLKEEGIRQLRDKQDLFVGGENVIKLGKHRFSVNTQPLDLTMVNRGGEMFYHLTGTNFFEEVDNADFLATKSVWSQSLVSENETVYRGEYLAYQFFVDGTKNLTGLKDLSGLVRAFAAKRYHEGYTKGIHDEDAIKIVSALVNLYENIDLLHYTSDVRAFGKLFLEKLLPQEKREYFHHQLASAGTILEVFPKTHEFDYLIDEIELIIDNGQWTIDNYNNRNVAQYLFDELTRSNSYIISKEAGETYQEFLKFLKKKKAFDKYEASIKVLENNTLNQYNLIKKWVQAFVEIAKIDHYLAYIDEVAVLLLVDDFDRKQIINVSTTVVLDGLHGSHSVMNEGKYELDYNAFMQKMDAYMQTVVPSYEQFQGLKKDLSAKFRKHLRLEEFKPRVLSSFVRNKLIDDLYLPIFGDNLAKQIGAVGENTRTDRMGMLLLISPPGYGKTTLMEYIANRLGLIFMKINGPAIGHRVTSLDPSEANNAAARQELEKLNLALEMGDNIMLYLDDIQHCDPEFLQKFISLTDGQRKIEGVYKGETKTYDLRGKKVCVVMAGNPYTESGDKFRIPDMLANRADIYNLGDIIGDTKRVFEMSYIENSLTANPVLQKLATKSMKDVYAMLHFANPEVSGEEMELESNHSTAEITEYVNVLQKMIVVRDVISKVNQAYIASAAQADEYRTEPSFLLQGSYRNMNKLAEKIVPIMNDAELKSMILAHYESESQTLTTGSEANLLKFKELNGWLASSEAERWMEIKQTFSKNKVFKGLNEADPMVAVLAKLGDFVDGIEGIREVLEGKK
ncbi:MAG: DNA repair ATPase [Saprospiraceae bacterium]